MGRAGGARLASAPLALALAAFALGQPALCRAQENPLDNVQTPAPPPPAKSPDSDSETPKRIVDLNAGGATESALRGDARLRVDVNLVRVPTTVTDPLNRIVTGLEKENFALSDNNIPQAIRYFSGEDTPITIGVVFDLSGSMASKFVRARKALTEFLRTSNPQDEFFVVGFNDRPSIIVDYTSDPDDVEARMVMLKPENRTALIDAVYLAVDHLRLAKYDRKALLIISDGGDNRSRYTESELERVVRESGVQVYSIGIFDNYAPSPEEQMGPELLKEMCEMTGGRLFNVGSDTADLEDIAERISAELRNQYVLGYTPSEVKRDGSWRKLKVKLTPPPGLPLLTVHFRDGYYEPAQ
jgi:Ca-activated chloride channel family protein